MTVAPVEGAVGAPAEVRIGEEGDTRWSGRERALVEVKEGSGLDAPVKVTSGAEK